jgi:hypothetical protein
MVLSLSRAAARFAFSIVRRAGSSAIHPDWTTRAEICERCPLRVVVGCVSYCGQPMYRKPYRDESIDGCGCPTREKAKSPDEHCPLTASHLPPIQEPARCNCKWCVDP